MNWYVLFVLTQYENKLCQFLQDDTVTLMSAKYEHYRRDRDCLELKSLFPGYIFVQTKMDQTQFNEWLRTLENKQGLIKQLSYTSVSALTKEERKILDVLLDKDGILRMSYGHMQNKKLVIDSGPLMGLDDYIIKYDKRNRFAQLNLSFIQQRWKAGVTLIDN